MLTWVNLHTSRVRTKPCILACWSRFLSLIAGVWMSLYSSCKLLRMYSFYCSQMLGNCDESVATCYVLATVLELMALQKIPRCNVLINNVLYVLRKYSTVRIIAHVSSISRVFISESLLLLLPRCTHSCR